MLDLMRSLLVPLVVVALAGCGSSNDAGTPTRHSITNSQAEQIPTNTQIAIGPFSVPASAQVAYVLVDTPIGVGYDTMDVAVVTDASANTGTPVGYGIQQNVSSTSGATPPLPAGTYDLLVQCFNLADDCAFQATIEATY